MAIRIRTKDAESLLFSINSGISDGSVTSWAVDDDGDYAMTGSVRSRCGWLRPRVVTKGEITFNTIGYQDKDMSTSEYAKLHCDFLKMLLNHFDLEFEEATISAQGDERDEL